MAIKNTLIELFGKSPIRPIQEHMEVSTSAADELLKFIEASKQGQWQQASEVYDTICDIENRADDLKRNLRLHLPKSLFLPVPRGDLLELLTVQDKIANISKDIAGLMLGRKMAFPQELQSNLVEFLSTSIATAKKALSAIHELDELLESGFSGRELTIVEKLVEELNDLEKKADGHERTMRAGLFQLESELPPVEVMFLYRAIEFIGELADNSQKVGSRLLLLLAR
ncbi:MAG: putative phosphate transport protein (TIGR00153 family) [Lentisphaeria bacterium]|jgi:predicted phosphate transport protein (TIGR00153 family)